MEQTMLQQPSIDLSSLRSWWAESGRRILPWRVQPNLYKTVVSEFMLQQTTVGTVVPFFERWMQKIPNFEALSRATENEILLLWSGLGYYGRARRLKELASLILRDPPKSYDEWLCLSGIGPYTAAAIASIACNDSVAVVDGNVVRVWSRLIDDDRVFKNQHEAYRCFFPLAQAHIFLDAPGDYNQAVMDLGATVCTPKNPDCAGCPLNRECGARRNHNVNNCPRFAPRRHRRQRRVRLWIQRGRKLLVRRISDLSSTSLNGFYELPERTPDTWSFAEIKEFFFRRNRSIGQCTFTEEVYRAEVGDVPSGGDLKWIHDVHDVPLSGPHRRWILQYLLNDGVLAPPDEMGRRARIPVERPAVSVVE
jgi:A/G-specific adenine glycosylase